MMDLAMQTRKLLLHVILTAERDIVKDKKKYNVGCRMRFLMLLLIMIKGLAKDLSSAYIYNENVTWNKAFEKCQMVGLDDKVHISVGSTTTAWVGTSANYTPWAEYQGCFIFNDTSVLRIHQINPANPFLSCSEWCPDYTYFGLQNSQCGCLKGNTLSNWFLKQLCISKPCQEDKNALCSDEENGFAIYKKVKMMSFTNQTGNCMTVNMKYIYWNHQYKRYYSPRNCSHVLQFLCQEAYNVVKGLFASSSGIWINGYTKCVTPAIPASVSVIDKSDFPSGQFWIGAIRRFKEIYPAVENPEYCVAAKVGQDGRLSKEVRQCSEKLYVLCKGTAPQSSNTGNHIPVIDDKPTVDVKPSTTYANDPESRDNKNTPSSVDTARNNETNEKKDILQTILIIVSVVSTVVISIIVGMIVCIVRWKVRCTKSSNQTELSVMVNVKTNATNPPQNDSLSANNQPAIRDMIIRTENTSKLLDECQYSTIDDDANTFDEQNIIKLDSDGYVKSEACVTIHKYIQRNVRCTKDANHTKSEMPPCLNVFTNATNSHKDNSLCTNNQTAVCEKKNEIEDTRQPIDESQYEAVDDAANETTNTSGERDIIEFDGNEYVRPTARVSVHEYSQLKVRRTIDTNQTECKMPALLNVNTNVTNSTHDNSLCTKNQPAYCNVKPRIEHTRQPLDESEYETVDDALTKMQTCLEKKELLS